MQRTIRPSRARQWGRAGPIMALVSILIAAGLAQVTLAQFGFTQQEAAKAATTPPAKTPEREGDDDATTQAPGSTTTLETANPSPTAAADVPKPAPTSLDKARGVQVLIDRQAEKLESQIEAEGN